jgi:hypothetical protein
MDEPVDQVAPFVRTRVDVPTFLKVEFEGCMQDAEIRVTLDPIGLFTRNARGQQEIGKNCSGNETRHDYPQ